MTLAAFGAGWYLGGSMPTELAGGGGDDTEPASAAVSPAPAAAGRERASGGDWPARVQRLDALVRGGEAAAAEALRTQLLDEVMSLAQAGQARQAAARLQTFLASNPHDTDAHLLDSDLRLMRGDTEDAAEPLLALLAFADDPEAVASARRRLELIVSVLESQLAARGDLPGLIRFLERLSLGDPGYDGHRLRLARWQLQAGELEAAEATLAQTGVSGVDPQARDDLMAALALAREGLPFERRAGADGMTSALHVQARTRGGVLRLLVDTGSTKTAISRARADALGTSPTGQTVQVQTAGGPVDAEVHRLRDVEIGSLHLAVLEVLVLEQSMPAGVDGLLGMDVLGRLPDQGGATR